MEDIKLELIRNSFYPPDGKVKFLFVGESPPYGGKFFYNANTGLYKYTKEAFSRAINIEWRDDAEFLYYFRDHGFFLDDLCHEPVNQYKRGEGRNRQLKRQKSLPDFTTRMKKYNPENIIIVMKAIEKFVKKAIEKNNLSIVTYLLPFPSYGHQQQYVDKLVKILKNR